MDLHSQELTTQFLTALAFHHNITVITVVHNINPLVHHIDNLLLLNNDMVAFGSPEKVLTPQMLKKAYGTSVPVVVCEEGYFHPLMEDTHG